MLRALYGSGNTKVTSATHSFPLLFSSTQLPVKSPTALSLKTWPCFTQPPTPYHINIFPHIIIKKKNDSSHESIKSDIKTHQKAECPENVQVARTLKTFWAFMSHPRICCYWTRGNTHMQTHFYHHVRVQDSGSKSCCSCASLNYSLSLLGIPWPSITCYQLIQKLISKLWWHSQACPNIYYVALKCSFSFHILFCF